jgi:homoserine dehydrogenase
MIATAERKEGTTMTKDITIGFLGCGNVGSGVWRLLEGFAPDIEHRAGLRFNVKKVLVRSLTKKRDIQFPAGVLTTNPDDILNDPEIQMVVEFLGGEEPAYSLMLRALNAGKTVVTANKVAFACTGMNCRRRAKTAARGSITRRRSAGPSPLSIRWRKACRPTGSIKSTASSTAPPTISSPA